MVGKGEIGATQSRRATREGRRVPVSFLLFIVPVVVPLRVFNTTFPPFFFPLQQAASLLCTVIREGWMLPNHNVLRRRLWMLATIPRLTVVPIT